MGLTNAFKLNIFGAFLCLMLSISCSAFDSSEIRMIEEEYDKRDPLRSIRDFVGESEKRSRLDNPLIRFGKRAVNMEREIRDAMQMDPLIRFGKRSPLDGAPLIRFGKRMPYDGAPLIRFGKRSPYDGPLIRFGKREPYNGAPLIRFGKRSPYDGPLIRFGKRPDTAPLIRFGKRGATSAMMSAPHIRFGKRAMDDMAYSRFSRNRPSPADQDIMLRFGRSTPATMTDEEK